MPLIRTHAPIGVIDGHDPPGLIDELVPSLAAVVDEIVVGTKDAVREPVVHLDMTCPRPLGDPGGGIAPPAPPGSSPVSIFTTSPERRCVIYVIIAAVFRHAVALASAHTGWDSLGDGGADVIVPDTRARSASAASPAQRP